MPRRDKKLIGWLKDMGVVDAAVAMIEPAMMTRRSTKATVFLFTVSPPTQRVSTNISSKILIICCVYGCYCELTKTVISMTVNYELGETRLQDMVEFIMMRSEDAPEVGSEIIKSSIVEALDMAFGDQVSNVVQEILAVNGDMRISRIETESFLGRLKSTFGEDSEPIEKIIYGRMLARFYLVELRKKIGFKQYLT